MPSSKLFSRRIQRSVERGERKKDVQASSDSSSLAGLCGSHPFAVHFGGDHLQRIHHFSTLYHSAMSFVGGAGFFADHDPCGRHPAVHHGLRPLLPGCGGPEGYGAVPAARGAVYGAVCGEHKLCRLLRGGGPGGRYLRAVLYYSGHNTGGPLVCQLPGPGAGDLRGGDRGSGCGRAAAAPNADRSIWYFLRTAVHGGLFCPFWNDCLFADIGRSG